MNCAACGSTNREGVRFCEQCGTPLARHCATCGSALPPTAQFCGNCGQPVRGTGGSGPLPLVADPRSYTPKHLADKILTSRAALEGERKQVTVFFADVKGSMELAEQIDPEEWHRILDGFFAILTDGVHRFEGTINQYTGDGIMALFGAPIAHEDHAQRACYAALHVGQELRRYAEELKRTLGLSFAVRMGLNSGEVVVGKIGDDLRMDYTAQGHTVGLAARLEQLADPGTAYLSEHTAALIAGFFRLRDLNCFTVKGVREPLRVYALEGVGPLHTRLDVSRARGFSRFVGREEEMAMLGGALARTLEGQGQVVSVVAEPGVGKSRLCYEFTQQSRARGIAVHEAHCVAYGKMIPFLPVLELLRSYFGITDADTDEEARRKVAGTLLLLDHELTESLPLLLDFLGVPDLEHPAPRMDPTARQRQLFALIMRLVHARSRRQPTVLLIEDLHWIDGGSEDFLEHLIAALPQTRTLLVVNFRPEYRDERVGRRDGSASPIYHQLALRPLGAEATTELLTELLGTDPSVSALAARIRERTGGNPFFIEEVIQSLFDQGMLARGEAGPAGLEGAPTVRLRRPVTDTQIPATVQAVLAARIDRLPEREKAVLQTAAVIGKRVPEPVLRAVLLPVFADGRSGGAAAGPQVPFIPSLLKDAEDLAAALSALSGTEFLYVDVQYPEAVYAFKHPLTQEVAYHSQLAAHRAQIHAAVAQAIALLYPDKLDERAALLAHHWEGAGDLLTAAQWSRRAAERLRISSLAEAARHWRNVSALLARVAETAETTALVLEACVQQLELGWRLGIALDEASRLFTEGDALAMRSGDPRSLAMLLIAYAVVRSHAGSADEFVQRNTLAARLAEHTDDAGLQLATRTRLVIALSAAGDLTAALDLIEPVLAQPPLNPRLGAAILGYSPFTRLLRERGRLLIDLGRLDEGARELQHAAQRAREDGDVEVLGCTHWEYATLARVRGDAQTALAHALEAMRIAEKLGSPFFRSGACVAFGHAHILAGKWAEARGALEEALAIARAGRAGIETEALALAWLSAAFLGLGNIDQARALADEALAVSVQRHTRAAQCVAQIGRARVMLRGSIAEQRDEIDNALRQALVLVEETGARSNEPFIRVELARLARAVGDEATWQRELRAAHRLFTQMGAAPRAARVARDLDTVHIAAAQPLDR